MRAAEAEPRSYTEQDCDNLFAEVRDERRIAVAVSGGSDSMALLRLVTKWAGEPVEIPVLTVDHGLRPEAAAEAAKVADWCARLGLEHHTLRWEGPKPKTGLQAKARVARYDLLSKWCREHGIRVLLTGHTVDDQAETVLMRQARTDTAESLAGIWKTAVWGGVQLFRPLLEQSRADLRAYLQGIGQPWIDDPSNEDVKFERVRVRQELAQGSQSRQRKLELAEIAERSSRTARALAHAVAQWLDQQLTSFPEGFGAIPRAGFRKIDPEVQRRVLQQLILAYGAGIRAQPGELDHLARWITGTDNSRRTLGGAIFACRQSSIMIGREWARISPVPVFVPDSGMIVWDGRFQVQAPPKSEIVPLGYLKNVPRREDLPHFVQQGLPAVILEDQEVAIPHLGLGRGVSAKFIGHLR